MGKKTKLPLLFDSKELFLEDKNKLELVHIYEKAICNLNKTVIKMSKEHNWGHKGDSYKCKSSLKLKNAIISYLNKKGDKYDKVTELLIKIVQAHAFSSANRRTAFLSASYFLIFDEKKGYIDNALNISKFFVDRYSKMDAKMMIGIREGNYYEFNEIKEFLKTGKIREYKR